jgi:hypothetical protein
MRLDELLFVLRRSEMEEVLPLVSMTVNEGEHSFAHPENSFAHPERGLHRPGK